MPRLRAARPSCIAAPPERRLALLRALLLTAAVGVTLTGCSRREEAKQPALPVGNPAQATSRPGLKGNVIRTRSGLEYVVDRPGKPDAPAAGADDYVQVRYARGPEANDPGNSRPFIFRLTGGKGRQGWDEGIVGMREGEKRTLLIPLLPGEAIPGQTAMRMVVELVRVFPKPQIHVGRPGQGREAHDGEFAVLHYTGTIVGGADDGKKFESTYDDNQPLRYATGSKFNRIIEGWHDAVRGMKEGEKRTAIIPPQLAFGSEGIPGHVPPDSTVKLELELLKFEPGIQTTIEKQGSGDQAKTGDTLRMHYTGTLAGGDRDGEKFDSSFDHEPSEPLSFELGAGKVITGWDIGIQGMRPGEKRVLVIPPEWGYGPSGNPPKIPANATLRFEVELVEIAKKG